MYVQGILHVKYAMSFTGHLMQIMNAVSSRLRAVASPKPIINQNRHTIYYVDNEEMLYATATTFLVAVENEKLMHWENNTNGQHIHELEYTIGFKSLTSTTLSERIAHRDSLKSVEINDHNAGTYKKFLSEEVLPERRLKTTVTVPSRSNLYFYQRKYVLETDVYFTHDGWSMQCVVVSNRDRAQNLKILSTIHSAEFTTTDQELQGMVPMEVSGQTKQAVFGASQRRFDDLTQRAKETLRQLGVNG